MKKIVGVCFLAALLLLVVSPVPSQAGGHVSFGFSFPVVIGPGYWGPGYWGPGYWGQYPYYYSPPPVAVQQHPVTYEQAAPAQSYWYYCQNPQGYYPYVQQCPNGWMQVVPPTAPPR